MSLRSSAVGKRVTTGLPFEPATKRTRLDGMTNDAVVASDIATLYLNGAGVECAAFVHGRTPGVRNLPALLAGSDYTNRLAMAYRNCVAGRGYIVRQPHSPTSSWCAGTGRQLTPGCVFKASIGRNAAR